MRYPGPPLSTLSTAQLPTFTESQIAMASGRFRLSRGTGIICLVACVAWNIGGGASPVAALIQPVGLNPLRLRPADLQSLSLEELKVINGKLWQALKDIRLQPPMSFTAFGQECKLPYSVKEMPLETPSEETLGYLSGFFAGDGCVTSNPRELKVSQFVQGAEVLFLFAMFFGGSIGLHSPGSGTGFPLLQWHVSGPKCRRAADFLSRGSLGNQRQLVHVALGTRQDYGSSQEMIRFWKRTPPTAVRFQSRNQVAGFFDAEGCFQSTLSSIQVVVHTKCRAPLEALQDFIGRNLFVRAGIHQAFQQQ